MSYRKGLAIAALVSIVYLVLIQPYLYSTDSGPSIITTILKSRAGFGADVSDGHSEPNTATGATKNPDYEEAELLTDLGNQIRMQAFNSGTQQPPPVCNMDFCFDYVRCPIKKPLTFYLYPLSEITAETNRESPDPLHVLYATLEQKEQRVEDPENACLFIALMDTCGQSSASGFRATEWYIDDLKNHIFWAYCSAKVTNNMSNQAQSSSIDQSSPIMQVSDGLSADFRPNFDIISSHWKTLLKPSSPPPSITAKRNYLLGSTACDNTSQSIFAQLKKFHPADYAFVDMKECNNASSRSKLLQNSTFGFILLRNGEGNSEELQQQLYETLQNGAIPVVVGTRFIAPYNEVLDWSRVMITIAPARINEMNFMLRSISADEILTFRKNGRLLFQRYMSSMDAVTDTILAILRSRIGLPPAPYSDIPATDVYIDTTMPTKDKVPTRDPKNIQNLSPFPEPPKESAKFRQNYSTNYVRRYDSWNIHYQPFKLYPFTPWDESLPARLPEKPAEAATTPSVNNKTEDSKKPWKKQYDGMPPEEQFTILMLAYKREDRLLKTLERYYPLPYLNKVVVVWNTPYEPVNLTWPNIGIPIEVVRPEKNSLNNRFLPYDVIQTEAVLSLDDDIGLNLDEVVFGFRVWLENKDRLVGYPGRGHVYKWERNNWFYKPTDDCQLSLVLTGAAFFHKMYMYKYSYEMPAVIRETVDKFMNCEDIAMNFLVAHVSQKPPIKVTAKRDFNCYGCKSALSKTGSHYDERSRCVQMFAQVYGYMPLRYTVARADSIFYRTGQVKNSDPPCFKNV